MCCQKTKEACIAPDFRNFQLDSMPWNCSCSSWNLTASVHLFPTLTYPVLTCKLHRSSKSSCMGRTRRWTLPLSASVKPPHVSECPARRQMLTQARALHTDPPWLPCSVAQLLPRGNQGVGSLFSHTHCLRSYCAIIEHLLNVHCTGHGWCHPY